jgi:hypothetical protein
MSKRAGGTVAPPSTYSTWSGFLSSDSKRLIQQGTDVDARVNASPYAWWEAIDGAHNNPEAMFQNYTVNPVIILPRPLPSSRETVLTEVAAIHRWSSLCTTVP